MTTPREAAYDEHIAPLMTKIIELCHEHKIPLLASFDLADKDSDGEGEDTLRCTTAIQGEGWDAPAEFVKALAIIKPAPPSFIAFVTRRTGA